MNKEHWFYKGTESFIKLLGVGTIMVLVTALLIFLCNSLSIQVGYGILFFYALLVYGANLYMAKITYEAKEAS